MDKAAPQAASGVSDDIQWALGALKMLRGDDVTAGSAVRWPLSSAMPPLGALPSAPGAARAHVRQVLAEWHLASVSDECELVVSELVTNALNASTGPGGGLLYVNGRMPLIRVCLMSDGRLIVIEVYDEAVGSPGLRAVDPETAEHGHGLHLVQNLTRGQWGWHPQQARHGKCVWAALPLPASPAPTPGTRFPRRTGPLPPSRQSKEER